MVEREGEALGEQDPPLERRAAPASRVEDRRRGGFHDVRTERNLTLSAVQRFAMNCSKSRSSPSNRQMNR